MIYIALDGLKLHECFSIFQNCKDLVTGFKIGPETLLKDIMEKGYLVQAIVQESKFFLDIKLHDIPQTVKNTLLQARDLYPSIVTVHTAVASSANIEKYPDEDMKIVGVTTLTSEVNDPLAMAHKVEICRKSGLDGVVCAASEVKDIKEHWENCFCVVPGIRPSWYEAKDDQKRTGTPLEAVQAGADALVIGRPITTASSPREACSRIKDEF